MDTVNPLQTFLTSGYQGYLGNQGLEDITYILTYIHNNSHNYTQKDRHTHKQTQKPTLEQWNSEKYCTISTEFIKEEF